MASGTQLVFAPFRLDPVNAQLWRDDEEIILRPKTLEVLRFLAEHPGQLVTKAALLDAVWAKLAVGDTMPAICVGELRKALADKAKSPRFIETIHRRGYRFIAKVTTATAVDVTSPPPTTPRSFTPIMVGREPELGQMRRGLESMLGGVRQVIFVSGEPGIGKTTLVRAFLDGAAREKTLRIGYGQCVEQHAGGEPYMPVFEALTSLCQAEGGNRLAEIIDRFAPNWMAQMPVLLSEPARGRLQSPLQGITSQRMLREMVETLETLATESPLVLFLEDLHWSDISTLELISMLAQRAQPARLLIIGTYRPVEMLSCNQPLRRMKENLELRRLCNELRLESLSAREVAVYLTQRFADTEIRYSLERVAPVIHKRTEGNPLFMINVVDYLVELGSLLNVSKVDTPRSVVQMIECNLEQLNPDEQIILESASVIGVEFSAALLAAVLARPVNEIETSCTRLSRREHFVASADEIEWPDGTVGAGFRFKHQLYRDVLYRRIPAGQRVSIHRQIAERQESAYGARAHEIAAELAYHYAGSHDRNKAIRYCQLAAERAVAQGALVEAQEHYTAALTMLLELPEGIERDRREFDLQLRLGMALRGAKSWSRLETFNTFTRAMFLGEKLGQTEDLVEVLFGLTASALSRERVALSLEMAERMLGFATTAGDRGLISAAQYRLGCAMFMGGQIVKAHEHLELATRYFDDTDARTVPADSRIHAHAVSANSALRLGFPDTARKLLLESLDLAMRHGTPYNQGFVHMFAILLYSALRDSQRVLAHADKLSLLAEDNPPYSVFADEHAAAALLMIGKREEGAARMRRALASGEFGLDSVSRFGVQAQLFASEGRARDALASVDDGLRAAVEARFYKSQLLRQRADLLLQVGGAGPEIEISYREAIDCANGQGNRLDELESTSHFARWLGARGRSVEARAMLAEIYNWFTEGFDTLPLKDAKTLLDELSKTSARSHHH